jgi:hypothetical protein
MARPKEARTMTETEYAKKLDELDRLPNDPDVPMEPEKVWSLLAELAQRDLASVRPPSHG